MSGMFRIRHGAAAAAIVFVAASAFAQSPSAATRLATMTQRGPETAPITIVEFSDFECPFCARMPPVLDELAKKYPDKVQIVFKHIPLPIHPRSPLAHEAAVAAGDQGKFWEMHNLLFANQARLNGSDLGQYARDLKLDVARFQAALESHEFRPIVARDMAEANALGVTATPTFFINGRRLLGAQTLATLDATVEEILTGRPPVSTTATVPLDSIDIVSASVRGNPSAPITIVEFSDLQCPFCSRANPVLDQVLKKYGDKVRLAFKHYPLDIHPNAPLAHRAALAAGEQGKFWEMHDALFANQSKATQAGIAEIARQLGMDPERLQRDMLNPALDARIQKDKADGDRLGVDGTPTFFINGVRLVGARPLTDFGQIIDRQTAALLAADPAVALAEQGRALGSHDAKVTVLWFADLRNPLNSEASQLVRQLATDYGQSVRIVFKHSPIRNRTESAWAYDAALAAAAQGHFWEMEDLLSGDQSIDSIERASALAGQLGLDVGRFETHLRDRAFRSIVAADAADADRLNVRGTPTFFVGDERVDGLVSFDALKDVVERHLRSAGGR
jgi:protein-disulfide isomerase